MKEFKFDLNQRVSFKDDIYVVLGRAQYIVRPNNMYMLQKVEKDVEFDLNMNKSFWEDENNLNSI
jgi:hypothetical protein